MIIIQFGLLIVQLMLDYIQLYQIYFFVLINFTVKSSIIDCVDQINDIISYYHLVVLTIISHNPIKREIVINFLELILHFSYILRLNKVDYVFTVYLHMEFARNEFNESYRPCLHVNLRIVDLIF